MAEDSPEKDNLAQLDLKGMVIAGIRRGKGGRSRNVYAYLMDADGKVVISATLDYIVKRIMVDGV